MDWVVITSTIGLSSIISTVITYLLGLKRAKKELRFQSLNEEKKRKYQHMLALILVVIDESNVNHIESNFKEISISMNISVSQYCKNQLYLYMNYMYLYAGDSVISSMDTFVKNKGIDNYKKAAREMYKDLWK